MVELWSFACGGLFGAIAISGMGLAAIRCAERSLEKAVEHHRKALRHLNDAKEFRQRAMRIHTQTWLILADHFAPIKDKGADQ